MDCVPMFRSSPPLVLFPENNEQSRPARAVTLNCSALQKPPHALRGRSFLRRSDQQNIAPLRLNRYLIGLVPSPGLCPASAVMAKQTEQFMETVIYKSHAELYLTFIPLPDRRRTVVPNGAFRQKHHPAGAERTNVSISCLTVHLGADVRWGDGDGRGLQKPAQTESGPLQTRERRRLPR